MTTEPNGAKSGAPSPAGRPARSIENFARDVTRADQEHIMLDILMLALAAGFFALAIGYTYACERL
jgi:hypothetical protein